MILAGLLVWWLGSPYPDFVIGALIGLYVIKEAVEILGDAAAHVPTHARPLHDRPWPDADVPTLAAAIAAGRGMLVQPVLGMASEMHVQTHRAAAAHGPGARTDLSVALAPAEWVLRSRFV